jgi:hypothetical protein
MGTDRCPILELNHVRTGIGTVFRVDGVMALYQPQQGKGNQHQHKQTTIKKHWNGVAPSALKDGSGVAWRRQKKAVRCRNGDSLMWQRQGDDGAVSAPARRGQSASTLANNNQQVKQLRVVTTRRATRGGSRQYDERESRGGGDNTGDNAGSRRLLAAAVPNNGAWYQRGGQLRTLAATHTACLQDPNRGLPQPSVPILPQRHNLPRSRLF